MASINSNTLKYAAGTAAAIYTAKKVYDNRDQVAQKLDDTTIKYYAVLGFMYGLTSNANSAPKKLRFILKMVNNLSQDLLADKTIDFVANHFIKDVSHVFKIIKPSTDQQNIETRLESLYQIVSERTKLSPIIYNAIHSLGKTWLFNRRPISYLYRHVTIKGHKIDALSFLYGLIEIHLVINLYQKKKTEIAITKFFQQNQLTASEDETVVEQIQDISKLIAEYAG